MGEDTSCHLFQQGRLGLEASLFNNFGHFFCEPNKYSAIFIFENPLDMTTSTRVTTIFMKAKNISH